jgi:hypothetical protein
LAKPGIPKVLLVFPKEAKRQSFEGKIIFKPRMARMEEGEI